MTFLYNIGDGERAHAKIVKKILDHDAKNQERIKMLILHDNDRVKELIAYNELCNLVAKQHDKGASEKDKIVALCRNCGSQGSFEAGRL